MDSDFAMTQTRKAVGTMKRHAMKIQSIASPKAHMPPAASTGYLSSCRAPQKRKAAATTKTTAYPKATSRSCVRQEMESMRTFYRPDDAEAGRGVKVRAKGAIYLVHSMPSRELCWSR